MTHFTIGVGNSSLSIAIWEESQCHHVWSLGTDLKKTTDEYQFTFQHILGNLNKSFDSSVICSVVPGITKKVVKALQQSLDLDPLVVSKDLNHGLKEPISKEIGADILANAVAAHAGYVGPSIVFDFGTALSIVAVSNEGEILGANIFPGITTACNSLVEKTALLHSVDLLFNPKKVLGKTTEEALQIGVLNGYLGVLEHNILAIEKQFGESFHCIGTGGDSRYIPKNSKLLRVIDPLHTQRGLRILAELNHPQK